MRPSQVLVVFLATAIALGALGVGYALWSADRVVDATIYTGEVDFQFSNVSCSDPPGTIDLGASKDVGWSECTLVDTDGDGDTDSLEITVHNTYPGYQMMANGITIQGLGSVPLHVTDVLLVQDVDPGAVVLEGFWTHHNLNCLQLHQGDTYSADLWVYVRVLQPALQSHTYTFRIEITGAQWNETDCPPPARDLGGSPGFWGNWDRHNAYTQAQIEGWLAQIDTESLWLGPTTASGMQTALRDISSMEAKFRRAYLAVRLDLSSGRLAGLNRHNVIALDPGNYLALAAPGSATLNEIVAAMEAKFGTSPTNGQFEIMKDVSEALYSLVV